jgi:DNA (cytosine-5)-methyltransferase 1
MGYHRAGFDVVGVDINPQPNYPFEFHRADAMTYPLDGFDAIHASPPCQAYSTATLNPSDHPDMYESTRSRLQASGVPWVIENVIGAPYLSGVVLCGSMFDLGVRRHRNFECSFLATTSRPCNHQGSRPYTVTGHLHNTEQDFSHSLKPSRQHAIELMGMPWATWQEVVLAIPPAYTKFIGGQLLDHLASRVVTA